MAGRHYSGPHVINWIQKWAPLFSSSCDQLNPKMGAIIIIVRSYLLNLAYLSWWMYNASITIAMKDSFQILYGPEWTLYQNGLFGSKYVKRLNPYHTLGQNMWRGHTLRKNMWRGWILQHITRYITHKDSACANYDDEDYEHNDEVVPEKHRLKVFL